MDFFRRASKTASDITPPIVLIEELKTDIADLKDELESAIQAKKFATETLKSQMDANARTEQELTAVRAELLEVLARQQAEVPVMAAPSPNGSNRIMLGTGELVSVGEGETLMKQLSERVRELEHHSEGLKAESDSLKKINKENLIKLRDALVDKHSRVDEKELERLRGELEVAHQLIAQMAGLEAELVARNDRIVELEKIIASSMAEIERIEAAATQTEKDMQRTVAENEVLRMRVGEMESEIVQLRGDLDFEIDEKQKAKENENRLIVTVAKLEREIEQQSVLIDSLRNDLATASESSGEEIEKLRASAGEYEDQILELISQVATLKSENGTLNENAESNMKELIQARKDADEAVRRLEQVAPKIDESHAALVKAVQTALEARKETLVWKNRYEADIRCATDRIKNLTAGGRKITPVGLLN
jgi:chromosome segregation ATPase